MNQIHPSLGFLVAVAGLALSGSAIAQTVPTEKRASPPAPASVRADPASNPPLMAPAPPAAEGTLPAVAPQAASAVQQPGVQPVYSPQPQAGAAARPSTVVPQVQPAAAAPPGYVLVPIDSAQPASPESRAMYRPPQELAYHEGEPIPPGYIPVERPRRGLIIGGALTLGIPWVFSATAAVGADFDNKSGYLMIPAIGPWLMLAAGGASDNCDYADGLAQGAEYCESRAGARAVLFLDGITQTAGAVMLAIGLTSPAKRLVRDTVSLAVAPTRLGTDGVGLGARGQF